MADSRRLPTNFNTIREAIKYFICLIVKLLYGFSFGLFMWSIIIGPYGRFFDMSSFYYPVGLSFSALVAVLYMSWLRARTTMVLFLPSMLSNATQNYVIVVLFVALLTNPISNVAQNAVESVRVIGCSLMMTYEQVKERAKLISNPIIEILSNKNQSDLGSIHKQLMGVQQIVVDMRREMEFAKNGSDVTSDKAKLQSPVVVPSAHLMAADIQARLVVDQNATKEIVHKMKDILRNTSIQFDSENFGLKASFSADQLRQLARSANLNQSDLAPINPVQIMHENCLLVFQRAKSSCQDYAESIRQSCSDSVGSFLSAIFCSPLTFTLSSTCPWIMDQLVDENNLCNQMRESLEKLHIDPFHITGGAGMNDVYRNLTEQIAEMNDDILEQAGTGDPGHSQRLELSISFNNETREVFLNARDMVRFISDKYRMRQLFLDVLLFIYELYTTFTFVCIIIQAERYRRSYLDHIRFDNHYITGLFVNMDRRRRGQGKTSVLPLTREESERYIEALTCKRRTEEERKAQRLSCTIVAVFLAFVLSVLYLDNVFYSILDSVHEHALVNYKEIGHHELGFEVVGEGKLAVMVRELMGHLHSVYDMNRVTSTKQCLPDATVTSDAFYLKFAYLVVIYLAIDQISIYAMRLRRITSAFFYPDKEQQRIVFLYNLILMQRDSLRREGLANYVDGSLEDQPGNQDVDEGVYTVKDAFSYLANCVSESICCRHILRRHRRGYYTKI